MIQDFVTYILITASAFYALFSVYRLAFPARGKSVPHCAGCTGCGLRRDAIYHVSKDAINRVSKDAINRVSASKTN